jgi:hypothetical protein
VGAFQGPPATAFLRFERFRTTLVFALRVVGATFFLAEERVAAARLIVLLPLRATVADFFLLELERLAAPKDDDAQSDKAMRRKNNRETMGTRTIIMFSL